MKTVFFILVISSLTSFSHARSMMPPIRIKIAHEITKEGVKDAFLVVRDFDHNEILNVKVGKMDLETPIPIASSTKWISASLILKILEKHDMSLDTSIKKYLSLKLLKEVHPKIPELTFRQLLSFQSGLEENNKCTYSPFRWMNTKKCSEKIMTSPKFRNTPGFEYNQMHMAVAGYVIEQIENKKWNEIFQDEFKSLYSINNSAVSYYASPKKRKGSQNPLIAGGLVLQPKTYLNFLQTLVEGGKFEGKRYLSEQMIKELHKDHFPSNNFKVYKTPYETSGDNPHYALGNWYEGNEINSSGGAFGFYPWIDKKNRYYAIYVTEGNLREAMRSYNIVKNIRPLILKQLNKK
jgi:CubicO group peptidase (beta-lactamase class C family)